MQITAPPLGCAPSTTLERESSRKDVGVCGAHRKFEATTKSAAGIAETQTEQVSKVQFNVRKTAIFFFSRTFLPQQVKEGPGPSAHCSLRGKSRTGREAAGLRSLLPASVCQELVQSWRRASSSKLRLEG